MVDLYAQPHENKFGHIVIGLEGDLPAHVYEAGDKFANELELVLNKQQQGELELLTVSNFAKWYQSQFLELSPKHTIQTDDLLGGDAQVMWEQSPEYRIGIITENGSSQILDFRKYYDSSRGPYFYSPNREKTLRAYVPALVDSFARPGEARVVDEDPDIQSLLGEAEYNPSSVLVRGLTPEATHVLQSTKVQVIFLMSAIGVFVAFGALVYFVPRSRKIVLGILVVFIVLGGAFVYHTLSKEYYVSQDEVAALDFLRRQPGRRIVVHDQECLHCAWHTPEQPAVFANKRQYVSELSGKEIIADTIVFADDDRVIAKQQLDLLEADYIYLSSYEDYFERLPFSPGDYNIELIFQNANAKIWMVQ